MNKYLFVAVIALLFTACSTKRNTTNMDTITRENLAQLLYQEMPYEQLKVSGNVQFDLPGKMIPSVKLTIYNKKQEYIWINGQVAIMNAGRAMATPEKFQAYEKLTKTYVDENYNFINNLLGVNFIDYNGLERMLLGKVFLPVDLSKSDVAITDEQISINATKPLLINHKDKEYKYFTNLDFDGQLNLKTVRIQDVENQRELIISYEERENFNQMNLPKLVKIDLKSNKPKSITLKYNNFDANPMEVNFEIPSGYTKREIE